MGAVKKEHDLEALELTLANEGNHIFIIVLNPFFSILATISSIAPSRIVAPLNICAYK